MVQPEVRGERVVGGGGDDAIFEEVAGFEAEDAEGFDGDALIRGSVDDGGVGVVSDRGGKNLGGGAGGLGAWGGGGFGGFERTVEGELGAGGIVMRRVVCSFH